MKNSHIVAAAVGFLVGFLIAGLLGIRQAQEAGDINAVLVHQVDEQMRMTADVVGFEAADAIRRRAHDLAVERARAK